MARTYHCDGCKPKWPGYCAPRRCLCGHQECPAYASYVELSATQPAITIPQSTNTAWADRESHTWIDNL